MARRGVRWRPLWQRSWWLAALVALLAAGGAFLAKSKGPGWVLLGAAGALAAGKPLLDRIKEGAKTADERAGRIRSAARTGDERGGLQRVADLSDTEFGVHPAHTPFAYLPRDKESEVHDLLAERRPVLVVGHSMAGKSRMCAELARREFPGWPVFIPAPPEGLAKLAPDALPHEAVVWLNDLDRYLTGDGMRAEWLDRMVRDGNLIVATMRAREHEKFQPTKDVRPPQAEVLERFTIVRLKPDPDEQQRLAAQVQDPAMRAGVQRYGLAEYAGGGYLAVDRFETGESQHPLGAAMVRAAADWRRTGLDVVPEETLALLAPMYLPEKFRCDPGEDFQTALDWARELVDQTIRLLEPAAGGGYRVYDYTLDYLTRTAPAVPDRTWREAVAAMPAARVSAVRYRAYLAGQPHDPNVSGLIPMER